MATRPEPPPRSPFDAPPRAAAAPPEPEAPALEHLGYSPDDLSPVHAKLGPLVSHWTDPHPAPRPGAEALGRAPETSADTNPPAEAGATDGPAEAWEDPFTQLERRWTLDGAWVP